MKMSLALVTALLCGFSVLASNSTPSGFTDDFDLAMENAKTKGKLVYVCFSGSDWCHWCIKLEQEVFSDETFAASLKDDYELVFIDSPSDKSRLSESAKVKNPELTKRFNIRGFPTMMILDGKDGSEITHGSAYRPGGASAYIAMLKDIRQDPGKLKRIAEYEKLYMKPLKDGYVKLMTELNKDCGKALDEAMAKPENAGKPREQLFPVTREIVLASMAKFRALQQEAETKAVDAPEEIRESMRAFAASLADWISKIEQM